MSKERETVLNVAGMTCMSCVRHVDRALREIPGVSEVEVRLSEGKVLVQHDAAEAPIEAMTDALREEGYEATPAP